MKNSRHTRILEIIGDNVIETQDDLIEKLRESGYAVTQATVSRDIKQLGLIKTATKNGGYKYTVARNENSGNENKLKTIMRETVLSAQEAQNIVVLKTFSGMANAAAAALDALAGEAIVGSIAGDDTIFIVTRNSEDALEFTNFVKDIIGF
jgi:transcriptional regulator of arginine metabolism